jgi:decaprenylphospho-beta-D-erythro-pentofuranosid-2-ulose 2-reductase
MAQCGHGTIASLFGVAFERPRRSNFIYGSSKAGLDWFAQGVQETLVGSGVNLCIIRPGFATTKMTGHLDVPPIVSDPEEVEQAIVRAIASNKDMVWVPSRLRW